MLPLTACGLFDSGPKPEDAAERFLAAFASGDHVAAGEFTDAPDEAAELMDKLRGALEPTTVAAEVDQLRDVGGASAEVSFTATWTFAEDRRWSYPGTVRLHRSEVGGSARWVVRWSPAVLHPDLAAQQSVAVREQQPDPAPITDRDEKPLLAAGNVVAVLLHREEAGNVREVAAALANALEPLDPRITTDSIVAGAAKVDADAAYTVAVLREADYKRVKPDIYELPGVRFSLQSRMLTVPGRDFARQLLPSLREEVADQITGRPGWRVVTIDVTGTEVATLHDERPKPGTTVVTTLSTQVQRAAEDAIAGLDEQAMIVAMEPATGEVLAVAQNPAADEQGQLALTGRYPPGSTLKVVTAAAALQAGAVRPGSKVPCPGTTVIGGRRVPNNDRFDLGTVPLRTAFARSCNTTFAMLAAELPPDALTDAARQFGVGVDFVLAGATTVTGSVPPGDTEVARAEAGFGQGKTLASPFGMALLAATVASGSMPKPALIRGTETTVDAEPQPLPKAVLDALRPMMRAVVTDGTATALARVPGDVHGKTGTAQFGDGSRTHSWFVGYRGELAFAVLVADTADSGAATKATASFLGGLD